MPRLISFSRSIYAVSGIKHAFIHPAGIPHSIYVTGSAKKGLIADPNDTYLEICNLTWEFGTALKLGPIIPLA